MTATTKVPPAYDGKRLWFEFEDELNNWLDITELEPAKQGPAIRNRFVENATYMQHILDREKLADPNNGVAYLKSAMRKEFVKSNMSVFLWRMGQYNAFHRGSRDMLTWIAKIQILKTRLEEAWIDLILEVKKSDPLYQRFQVQRLQQYETEVSQIDPQQQWQHPRPTAETLYGNTQKP